MNREEQIKMWEMAAGKMEKTGEKFGTGGPKKPVTGASADARKPDAAMTASSLALLRKQRAEREALISKSAAAHAAQRDEHLRDGTYHS
jgi:hypothetical protein